MIWRDAGLRKEKWAAAGGEQLSRGSPGRGNPDYLFQGAASPWGHQNPALFPGLRDMAGRRRTVFPASPEHYLPFLTDFTTKGMPFLEFLCFEIQSLAKKVKNLATVFL